jgi:hypothetical protein
MMPIWPLPTLFDRSQRMKQCGAVGRVGAVDGERGQAAPPAKRPAFDLVA